MSSDDEYDDDIPSVIYISDDDEDVGDVLDVTDDFWSMMRQLSHTPFDEIKRTGIFTTVQKLINTEISYRIFVVQHDKYLEYQTIEKLLEGTECYYATYLPDSREWEMLSRGLEIIRFHIELERQIDDVAMQLSEL